MSESSADEQIKEVYAHFGLAFYLAQVLEHGLAHALIFCELIPARVGKPFAKSAWETEFDAFLNLQFAKTLGKLINSLKSATGVSDELEGVLKRALDTRNHLSHHFFRERAETFQSRKGRERMIEELEECQALFDAAEKMLGLALEPLRAKYNLTDEKLKSYEDLYLQRFENDR